MRPRCGACPRRPSKPAPPSRCSGSTRFRARSRHRAAGGESVVLSIVPIQVDGLWLALPAHAVQEILGQRPWIPITGAPSELPGVLAWRGRAIAVFDVGRVIDGAAPLPADESRHR